VRLQRQVLGRVFVHLNMTCILVLELMCIPKKFVRLRFGDDQRGGVTNVATQPEAIGVVVMFNACTST
jgi:hypothetical protein